MRIAIIAALPGELKPLVKGWQALQKLPKGIQMWQQPRAQNDVVAVCAGMGAAAARRAFAAAEFGGALDLVLSVGWAGGLDATDDGTAKVVSEIIDTQTGERFHPSSSDGAFRLVTAVGVANAAEKRRLAATYAATLVDMEAAAVARLAQIRAIPMICIKAVSDDVAAKLPDLNPFIDLSGQLRLGRFLAYVALRPGYWAPLAALGRRSAHAAEALAGAVERLLTDHPADPATRRGSTMSIEVPATMRAAVYQGIDTVEVQTLPVPNIGPGEVLVRIDTCGICGTDLKKIHSGSHAAPRIFGHEMAGTVALVGPGVERFAAGDRVMAFHHIPCGECFYCRKQTFAQCETYKRVGTTAGFVPSGGGFAEYIRVMDWIVAGTSGAPGGLVKIPDDIPFEQAAFIEPVNTCFKAIRLLDLAPDDTVLVIGQGSIGILLAALARRTGAAVLTSDLYPERHAIAARYGLNQPVDARSDVPAIAKAATGGRGADVALVAVGADALIATSMQAIRPGGRVMLFASTQHGTAAFDPAAVCMDEKTLMGSYSASAAIQEQGIQLVFDGYRDGSLDLTQLISHRFSLEDAVAAIDLASNPRADSMKIVIKP